MKKTLLFLLFVVSLTVLSMYSSFGQARIKSGTYTVTLNSAPGNVTLTDLTTIKVDSISGTIDALNKYGVESGGTVQFNFADGYTETATTTIFGGSYTPGNYTIGGGPANLGDPASALYSTSYNAVIFKHNGTGTNPVLTAKAGGSGSNDYIIRLLGVKNITLDGIDLKENSSNITNTTRMEWGYYLLNGVSGCQYNTIKNCKITMDRLNTQNTGSIGIYQVNFDNATSSSYNTYEADTVINAFNGIRLRAISGSPDIGCKVIKCYIGDPTSTGDIGNSTAQTSQSKATAGIYADLQQDITIRSCVINNVGYWGSGTSSIVSTGVGLAAGVLLTNNSGTCYLTENSITGIKILTSSTSCQSFGIAFYGSSSSTTYIHTNFISNCTGGSSGSSSLRSTGIYLGGLGTAGFYYNSINLYGTAFTSQAIINIDGPTTDIKNNLFKYNGLSASGGARNFWGIYYTSGTYTSDYNMFGYGTTSGNNNFFAGRYNPTSTNYATLATWQAGQSKDGNSVAVIPNFVTPLGSNLHLNLGNVYDANYQATTISTPTIVGDIDTLFAPYDADPLIYPLKGADQFSTVTGIIISPNQPLDSLVQQGNLNQVLAGMTFTVQGSTSYTFTGITFNTAGSFATNSNTDFGNFRLLINTTPTISGATQLGATITNTPATTGGTLAFTSGANFPYTLNGNTTYYIFLINDVGSGANPGSNISVTTTSFTNITFGGSPTKIGTNPVIASGTETVARFFYNYANSDITEPSSWFEKATFSPPGDFISSNQVFIVEQNTGRTMTKPWIVGTTTTTNVQVHVGQDPGSKLGFATLDANQPIVTVGSTLLNVRDSGILRFYTNATTLTKLGTLASGTVATRGSEVIYSDTAILLDTIITANYCHLTLSGTAGSTRFFDYDTVGVSRVFTTGGFAGATRGMIEFNGGLFTQIIPTGFNFWKLRVNNSVGTTTLAGNVNIDSLLHFSSPLTVAAGQKITLGTNAYVTNTDGGTDILTVNGTLDNKNPVATVFAGTTSTQTPNIVFGPNSIYDLTANLSSATNRGQIPPATWNATSTINITNVTMNTVNNIAVGPPSAAGFGNISFDAPSLGVNDYRLFGGVTHTGTGSNSSPWVVTLQGNLTLNRTNNFTVDLGAGTSVQSTILNVAGTYNQSNGIYRLYNSNGGGTGGRLDLSVAGDITLSSGTQLILTGPSLSASNAYGRIYAGANFTANSGTTVTELGSSANSAVITFTKTGTQTLTTDGATFANDLNYTVNATSNTALGTSSNLTVNGPAYINLLTGGIFDIAAGNTLTINGTINNLGTVQTGTFSGTSTSDLILGGSVTMDTAYFTSGSAVLRNLTLDRTSPATMKIGGTTDLTVHGTLTISGTNSNDTLDMMTNALFAAGSFATSIHSTGALKTANTTATPLPAAKTWGGFVWYYSASAQTMINGNFNILKGTNGNRTLSSTGTIGIAGAGTCFIPGAGTYTIDNSTVDFNGSGAQDIPQFTFENMITSNGSSTKTLVGNVGIRESLTLNNTTTLQLGALAGGSLTLMSTATKTARLNPVTTAATITYPSTGLVFVQRYFPARRAWRLLSVPINPSAGTHTISEAWQERATGLDYSTPGAASASITADTIPLNPPGFATLITGGTTGNGFDQGNSRNNPSIKYFSAGNWPAPPNTNSWAVNDPTNNREGYMVFVRGDRKTYGQITDNTKAPNITTLRPRGQLFIGTKTVNASAGGGFKVVANPYAAPVDFHAAYGHAKTGTWPANASYYIWDPHLGGSSGAGAFVALTWNGVDSFTRGTPFATGYYNNNDSKYIPSGEAIMVSFPSGGTMQFQETDKATANTSNLFRPMPAGRSQQLRTVLKTVTDKETYVSDGALALFNNSFNNSADEEDMRKLGNFKENVVIEQDNKLLAIERRKLVGENDTIFYGLYRMERKHYQLQFIMQDIAAAPSLSAFLEDTYLKTKTPVNIGGESAVDFNITDDAASAVSSRFRLVFKKSTVYSNLKAFILNSDIAVEWKVADEFNISGYEIERSSNGNTFSKIGTAASKGNSDAAVTYSLLDVNPAPGEYYYRVKSISNNGIITYSDAVKVKILKGSPALYVFPNPVTDGNIQLQLNSAPAGKYSTKLMSSNGQLLSSQVVAHAGGTATKTIRPKNTLNAGSYQLEVIAPDKKVSVIKVIVNNN